MIFLQILQDHRALHRIPELDSCLVKTIAYIRSRLEGLPCRVFSPVDGAVCAFFDFGMSGTLAFRADCDALPIQEQTGLSYASVHEGCMHACGHDGHMAILLETARRIRKSGRYNVLLIFQPAEETTGGAKEICDTGVLEQYRVDAIFALHLWPGLPKGELFSRPGLLMASSAEVRAEFFGRAVHIASCEKGADALHACCRFYCMAQKFPCFLRFGKLTGGRAGNIVCDRAVIEGSLRTKGKKYPARLQKLCRRACKGTGCRGRLTLTEGYPAVFNDPVLYGRVRGLFGVQKLAKPLWTAEDFSYYQKKVPGAYFLLGVGDTPPLHSPRFCFDEQVLLKGADFFQTLLEKL